MIFALPVGLALGRETVLMWFFKVSASVTTLFLSGSGRYMLIPSGWSERNSRFMNSFYCLIFESEKAVWKIWPSVFFWISLRMNYSVPRTCEVLSTYSGCFVKLKILRSSINEILILLMDCITFERRKEISIFWSGVNEWALSAISTGTVPPSNAYL